MWRDTIVEEIRQAGEELAKKADYNLHTTRRKHLHRLGGYGQRSVLWPSEHFEPMKLFFTV